MAQSVRSSSFAVAGLTSELRALMLPVKLFQTSKSIFLSQEKKKKDWVGFLCLSTGVSCYWGCPKTPSCPGVLAGDPRVLSEPVSWDQAGRVAQECG